MNDCMSVTSSSSFSWNRLTLNHDSFFEKKNFDCFHEYISCYYMGYGNFSLCVVFLI